MNEQHEVHLGRPLDCVPRRRDRLQALEHGEERIALQDAAGVEGQRAAPLEDDSASLEGIR